MGLFSSKSSSASNVTTTNTSIDKRIVADNGAVAVAADTVHMLDGGAIAKAFDFATGTLEEALRSSNEGVGAIANAYDQAKGEATQKNLIAAAALAVVAVVAIKVWSK